MIQFFIKIANNVIGKIIFVALLLGMCLGYGVLSRQSSFSGGVINVGGQSLSLKQLDTVFRKETQKLSSLMGGQYISPKQALEMGLLNNIITQQKNEMILSEIKDELGLTATNAAVQKYVENNPAFADVNGKFDRNLFLAYLRQNRMSESELASKLRGELSTRHLVHAVQGVAYAPEVMVEQAYNYSNETRQVIGLFIETDKIRLDKEPTEEDLRGYYEAYATERFMTPEYRAFSYLLLTPDALLGHVQVSESDVDAVYEERKSQFETPEKRLVSQMYFKDEESANQMKSRATPDNFDELAATELKQTPDITNFGYVTANGLTEELSEAVFKATPKTVIGPVATQNGFHLILVKEVQAAQQQPVTAVRDQIKKQLAQEKVYDKMEGMTRRLEDILGEGKSLSDAAKELKLPLQKVPAASIAGIRPNGQELTGDVANTELLQNLFTLKVGESTPVFESGKGVVVAELLEIIPVGTKSFEEVRPELAQIWTRDQQKEKLKPLADTIIERVRNGSSLSAQATFNNFQLIQDSKLTRLQGGNLPMPVVQAVFNQKQGVEGLTQTPTEKGIYITQLNYVSHPAMDKDKAGTKEITDNTQALIGAELLSDVVGSYAADIGVSVNEQEIDRAFSVYKNE